MARTLAGGRGTRQGPSSPPTPAERRQARYWDRRYRSDPAVFGARPSPFLAWLLDALPAKAVGHRWLELGSGYGRDLRAIRARGYAVRGIDLSRIGTSVARKAGQDALRGNAVDFLRSQRPGSIDVVYSNLFYNMEFSERDHERVFSLVHRALAPGGLHAYSVRTVSDPWFGKGVRVGPGTFDLAPDGPVMHFFSRSYARRLRAGRFRSVRSWEGEEDLGGFPTRVRYVVERKLTPVEDRGDRRALTP